ncbi:MAG: hypothetical protein RL134_260 [Actinomycetota bacterium]|jgi:fructoselysine-6-P-deglycase FrlB-like protein
MKPDAFEQDVHEVPRRLRQLADRLEHGEAWPARIASGPLLTGMGSSGYAARTTSGWLQAAGVAAVSEVASADPGWPGGPGTSAILISASGNSAETLDRSRRLGAGTQRIALVNSADSALALEADAVVEMGAGIESGEVACRTYRHTLALLLALGIEPAVVVSGIRAAADRTQQLLDDQGWLAEFDAILSPAAATFWIAPESRIGSAQQSALMVREIPRRLAVACETGDWSHVDVYLTLTMDYRCVMFTGSRWDGAAATWMTQRRAKTITIGEALDIPGEVNIPLVDDPIARMLTEPLFAELLALAWWRRHPVHVP